MTKLDKKAHVCVPRHREECGRADVFFDFGNEVLVRETEEIDRHLAADQAHIHFYAHIAQLFDGCHPFVFEGLLHERGCQRTEAGHVRHQ